MSRTVKTGGAKPPKTPTATTFEVIQDQGKVPFSDYKVIPTPKNLGKGTVTTGTSRGMGAMLRGGKFTIN
jgi:hypothetical protein|tara:strand:+ start:115 stop:324 length:210 start_codon:yes stop_codon:yes gene_type:complete